LEVVFIDTNIIIDFITERQPFDEAANKIFSLADTKDVLLLTSSLSFANAYYVIEKTKVNSKEELRKTFTNLKMLIEIIPVTSSIIDRSLADLLFSDFEDAVQYYAAIKKNCNCIITRNLKHFKKSKIPVFSSSDFINKLNL
jgi:predicted nucleic acid-binding protein